MNNNCMNMLRYCQFFVLGLSLLCLRLSHAQSISLPPAAGAPPISITPIPPATIAVPASGDLTKAPIKKYSEFKSICVRDEELPALMSSTVKEKRLALVQNKLDKAVATQNAGQISILKALLIREHIKQNNFVKAEEIFLREGIHLTETDRVLIATDIDLNKKLNKLAKNNLNKYLETHQNDILALEKLAEIYISLNFFSDATMAYEDLQKINSKKSYSEHLCRSATLNADHANVRKFCFKLQTQEPKNIMASIYLGISWRDQEKYPEAIKSFEKSMEIKPSEYASTCLAESLYLSKNFAKAIQQFETSVKIKPDSKRARLGLAVTYLKQNLFSEALIQFKEACKLGLQPLIEMSAAANTLKTQKSDLANIYFDEIQKCKK